MKYKILPYLFFFFLASIYTYYVSTLDNFKLEQGQIWESIPKGSIQKIVFEQDGQKAVMSKDKVSNRFWIETTVNVKTPKGEKSEHDRFLANESLTTVLEGFSPLYVVKIIGKSENLKLEEFGLDKPSGQISVTYGDGKTLGLQFGKRSFQSPEVFAFDEAKKTVFLLDRQFMGPLDRVKARLALVQPYSFAMDEVSAAKISFDNKKFDFVKEQKSGSGQWFRREKMNIVDESFRNWVDKFTKLKIESYPTESELTGIEQAELKVVVDFTGVKGLLEAISIYEEKSPSGVRYWLKSKNLPTPVGVDSAKVNVLLGDLSGFK